MKIKKFVLGLTLVLCFLSGCAELPARSESSGPESVQARSTADWQLQDDSILLSTIEPWPMPADRKVTIIVETGPGDWSPDKPVADKVEYRVTETETTEGGWTEIGDREEISETLEGESYEIHRYKVSGVEIPAGHFINFRIKGDNLDPKRNECRGWQIP